MYDLDFEKKDIKTNSSSFYDDKKFEEHGSIIEDDTTSTSSTPNESNAYSARYESNYKPNSKLKLTKRRIYGCVGLLVLCFFTFSLLVGMGIFIYKLSNLKEDEKPRISSKKNAEVELEKIEKDIKDLKEARKRISKNNISLKPLTEDGSNKPKPGVNISLPKNTKPQWNNIRSDADYSQNKNSQAFSNNIEKILKKKENTENISKPRKNIANYYRLTEEQLIKEVYDSLENDYDYYIRDTKFTYGQVKATLTTITYQNNYLKLLEVLLEKGFATKFVDKKDDFDILCMTESAAMSNKIEYLEILIKHGADLKKEDPIYKRTLLHAAAYSGNIDFAEKVIKAGVPIDKKDGNGNTALCLAVKSNKYDFVKFLIDKGAKIEDEYKELTNDRNIIELLTSKDGSSKADSSFPEDKEWEEAYDYIKNGDIDSLKVLESCGKDFSKMYYKGEPAICIAVRFGKFDILEYLSNKIGCGNKVDKINGRNVLHYSVMYYRSSMLKYLLRKDYEPNVQDNLGNTPLHYAASNPYPDYVKYLLKYGANPNILNNKKRNSLFFAVDTQNTSIFKDLIEKGADINQEDIDGNTPLQYAKNKDLQKAATQLSYLLPNQNNELSNNSGQEDSKRNKILEEFKKRQFEKDYSNIFRGNIYSSSYNLFKMSKAFLAKSEDKLIEEYNNICAYNNNVRENSDDYYRYEKLEKLFFLKIAFDKDYPELLKEVMDSGFKLDNWKIDYLPPMFYLADKNSMKCFYYLNSLKNSDLAEELDYEIGSPRNSNKSTCRDDGKLLYSLRDVYSRNTRKSWNEIIFNLDDNITEELDDDEIKHDIDVGRTFLHFAAKNGNLELADKAISAGVDINKKSFKEKTALYYAVKNNKHEMAKYLIDNGARLDEQVMKLNIDNDMANILEKSESFSAGIFK